VSENKKFYWLKLHDDFFSSKRIKKLRKLGSDFVIIYLKMQLLSLQNNGILEYTGIEDNFSDEIALDIDEDADKVQLTISYLQSCGLLECKDNSEFFLPYVEKCTGKETQSTIRSRRCRENKAEKEKALHCNADATPMQHQCNTEKEIDKEKEIDIEKDIYIKEKENKQKKRKEIPTDNPMADLKPDMEERWKMTFDHYPKKSAYATAQQEWVKKVAPNPDNISTLIYKAMDAYLKDYERKHPEDTTYQYIPKLGTWLIEDCDYWIGVVEHRN
jgi:predicted phage replisome organizer